MRGATGHHAGLAAEEIVRRHYEDRGLTLAHHRWRCKAGEIDLVLREGARVIFVEVKLAATHDRAAEKLGPRQIGRLFAAAEVFVGDEPAGAMTDIRFDVALVDARGRVQIRENAFS